MNVTVARAVNISQRLMHMVYLQLLSINQRMNSDMYSINVLERRESGSNHFFIAG